jgi:cell division protein FtsI (penicillin-binding protein 3)
MTAGKSPLRWFFLCGVGIFWATAIFVRLGYLQLFHYKLYLEKAERQQERSFEITPPRGTIYDRNGHELAMSVPLDAAVADPAEIADPGMLAGLVSPVLGISSEDIQRKLYEKRSKSFVWLAHKLTPEVAERLRSLNLRGIYLEKENHRFYPQGQLGAHLVGYVDTDERGIGGIEYVLEKQIRGRPGRMLIMRDAHGDWFDRKVMLPVAGASVTLTIDQYIQAIAERELATAMDATHSKSGIVLVMDPNSAEVLALANSPTFDLNAPGEASEDARMDRAVVATYEPGSTFKTITVAGAIEDGITNPDEVFDCQMGKIVVAGRLIHDHKPFGLLSVSGILEQSSDVGAIKIGLRLGAQRFDDYIQKFGFGQLTGIELPGESRGLLRHLENWTPSSIGSLAMGQEISITPVQLVTAISAIANGGWLTHPHVIREIRNGSRVEKTQQAVGRRVLSESTAATMRHMMEEVVLVGTAKPAQVLGYSSAGKTGTAQKIDPATGHYSPNQYIASFIGFAPVSNPAVTILVVLDSPVGQHFGGDIAGPVFKRIGEQILPYLGVPADLPIPPSQQYAAKHAPETKHSSTEDAFIADETNENEPVSSPTRVPVGPEPAQESTAEQVMSFDSGQGVEVPNLAGKSVRSVTEKCYGLGLVPILIGSGNAIEQSEPAGRQVSRGSRITVRFSPAPRLLPVAAGRK